jgi:hypothetical protein
VSLKDAAAREAYLKTLLDAVDDAYKATRTEVQELLDAAARETGMQKLGVSLPDGTQVATVSLSRGSAEAKVTDQDAFTAWVRAEFPSEVERQFVTTVRAAFTARVLKELTAAGGTEWADPATGVIHDVPGVQIAPSRARGHSVRFGETGKANVMQAWRDGLLAGVALPELTAGDDDAA